MTRFIRSSLVAGYVLTFLVGLIPQALRLSAQVKSPVSSKAIAAETREFLAKEVAAHFGNIQTLQPPPDRVFNALTVGEFSWGSFARALAAQADLGGSTTIAGKDTARAIAEMGLHESRAGGKAFSQLYSTLALRHYGTDLSKNAVWQSMNDAERKEWQALLDPGRFYDKEKREVINLPENYLGVAARIAAMSWQMGALKDRALVDSVVERAAKQFLDGALYADDNLPTGRYDRYSNEYARFCWDAADVAGRQDIKEKLKPSLKHQMKIWWDLVSPEGYGYNWGRSQGLVSYLDTLEIVAFLGEHPEFRPAPMTELAALYHQAWRWIRADYNDETHMFRVFDYGRGNYSYINPKREWQQTGTGFGKIILANHSFFKTLEREKIAEFPLAPTLPDVARFDFFLKGKDRQYGVWLVRRGNLQFALPITVGTKPGISDYLPTPYGLTGYAAPVEQVYPSLTPFWTLQDGGVYSASDGADEIRPGADALSLSTVNSRWAKIGSPSGSNYSNGLRSEVEWQLSGRKLTRRETVTATVDVSVKEWKFVIPSTATSAGQGNIAAVKTFDLVGSGWTLRAAIKPMPDTRFRIVAAGNGPLSRGVLGAIPIHIVAERTAFSLKKGESVSWELTLELLDR
ncbi:MAG: hypothetical protein ABIR33_08920 [Pyrinomonadaceae bacterium]